MSGTIRLTAAQAMMRWLSVQMTEGGERFIEGVWAIFGHGNVAGIGEALYHAKGTFPTWRGHNEQTMAHAAIAFAKTKARRQAMAVTSSISLLPISASTSCTIFRGCSSMPVILWGVCLPCPHARQRRKRLSMTSARPPPSGTTSMPQGN